MTYYNNFNAPKFGKIDRIKIVLYTRYTTNIIKISCVKFQLIRTLRFLEFYDKSTYSWITCIK